MTTSASRLLRTGGVCAMLNIGVDTLRKLAATGKIRCQMINGQRRYLERDVIDFAESTTPTAIPKSSKIEAAQTRRRRNHQDRQAD